MNNSFTSFCTSLGHRLLGFVLHLCLRLRYRVEAQGLKEILASPDPRPLLILPTHSALVDPLLLYSLLACRRPRPLADEQQVSRPGIRTLVGLTRPIIIPDMQRDFCPDVRGPDAHASGAQSVASQGARVAAAIRQGLVQAEHALRQGDSLLLYPAGRITRDGRDHVGGNSGAYSLYAALHEGKGTDSVPHCRVILVRIRGLWGSTFSCAPAAHPSLSEDRSQPLPTPRFFATLLRALPKLLANALFFMPRRRVRMTFMEAVHLPPPGTGSNALLAFNRALEVFYDAEAQPQELVPYYCWQGSAVRTLPNVQPRTSPAAVDTNPAAAESATPPDILHKVQAMLAEESGVNDAALLANNETPLSGGLGIDSLSLARVALRLEELGAPPLQRLDKLNTVGDCVLAVQGRLQDAAEDRPLSQAAFPALPPAPPYWHSGQAAPLAMPVCNEQSTVLEIFLRLVRLAPQHPALATPATATAQNPSSALTRRAALTRALALAAFLRTAPETGQESRVGIMLPASSAAALSWLAVLLAGKIPVMANWTVGEANLRHCLRFTATRTVLTSRALLHKLEQQGMPLQRTDMAEQNAYNPVHWLCLEDVAPRISLPHKVRAAIQTGLALAGLLSPRYGTLPPTADTAALLFTSGSETLPKAVPLSHYNVLSNCRDMAQVLGLRCDDSLLGMLPPFHSLGLTANVAVALALGVPTVFHPNPTEARALCEVCRDWRPTLTVAPPTFLEGMLREARDKDLASLRLGFVGAEKCPPAVYAAFAAQSGGLLCEGYGVTECSPVVCVNLPRDARPGTIGLPLPSVHTAVVVPPEATGAGDADTPGPLRRAAPGERGMLLVRGPNVFGGYLAPAPSPTLAASGAPAAPFVLFEGRHWYRTGDLVSADASGHMTFEGRLGRFLKLGGEMVSLPQMEATLLTVFAQRRAPASTTTPEGPLLAVEVPRALAPTDRENNSITLFTTVDISREEANAALRAAGLPALWAVRHIQHLPAIPVLGSGKTDHRALKNFPPAVPPIKKI